MNQDSKHWGVELNGADKDKKRWCRELKPPFDPIVEEVKDEAGDYLILRSKTFEGGTNSKEVHELAKQLFSTLNVVMSKNADADPVTKGAVVEFVPDGPPRKHNLIEVEGIKMRIRAGHVTFTVTDAQGNVIEQPPAPSQAQLWMRAATHNPMIGRALRYLEGEPGWFELFLAFEELEGTPNGGISKTKIILFKHTANAGIRHPPSKLTPPKNPMLLAEGHALMIKWVTAAIEDTLAEIN